MCKAMRKEVVAEEFRTDGRAGIGSDGAEMDKGILIKRL